MARPAPEEPRERTETLRHRLRSALVGTKLTRRQLSEIVGASERQIDDDLHHLARSLEAQGIPIRIEPARCLACGFVFEGRTRFGRPGKCPTCRSTHLSPPRFSIDAG